MRFPSKSGNNITLEELDEALSIEGKLATEIESVSRKPNTTLLTMKNEKKVKWRKLGSCPVKVSSSTIYVGVAEKLNSDQIRVKLSGVPPQMKREELVEWLSSFGSIKSDLKIKKIVGNECLRNVDGLVDRTHVEVIMDLKRDFREREIVEDMTINISYMNMPKTCWNCKRPGSECESGGGQGYLCKTKRKEISWDEAYIQEETEKDDNWTEIEERIGAASEFDFVEEDLVIDEYNESSSLERDTIPDNNKIAGVRI